MNQFIYICAFNTNFYGSAIKLTFTAFPHNHPSVKTYYTCIGANIFQNNTRVFYSFISTQSSAYTYQKPALTP